MGTNSVRQSPCRTTRLIHQSVAVSTRLQSRYRYVRREAQPISDGHWIVRRRVLQRTSLFNLLDAEGIDLEGLSLKERTAHLLIRNDRYDAEAQGLGRTMRAVSRTLPASVELIHVTLTRGGIPVSTFTMRRSDLERLEHAPARDVLATVEFDDALRFSNLPDAFPQTYPRFEWTHGPYLRPHFFDPAAPFPRRCALPCQSSMAPRQWVGCRRAHIDETVREPQPGYTPQQLDHSTRTIQHSALCPRRQSNT